MREKITDQINEQQHTLEVLKLLKQESGDRLGIVEIGIFGSFARGAHTAQSDVDVCVKTRTPNPFLLVTLKDELEKRLNRRVEIVRVRDKMNPFLRSRIEKESIYV